MCIQVQYMYTVCDHLKNENKYVSVDMNAAKTIEIEIKSKNEKYTMKK